MISSKNNNIVISYSTQKHGNLVLTQEMLMDEVKDTLADLLNSHSYCELAKLMNVSPNTLHKIASGCRTDLKIGTALKILQMGKKQIVIVGGSYE